jgi:ABC-type Na+ efflux pump permease subunit
MLPGPIFRREMKAVSGGSKLFRARIAVALQIAMVVLPPAWFVLDPGYPILRVTELSRAEAARLYAAYVFGATLGVEALMLAVVAAAAVGASIAEEREKDTLPLLLLTRLTRLELAATKLAGRLMPALLLMWLGLPLILIVAPIADLPYPVVAEAIAVVAGTVTVAGSLGILASSRRDRSSTAIGEAVAWTMIWLGGLPMASVMRVRSGTLWGDLLVEIRRIAGWIAPSSPLSLLTDPAWFSGPAGAAEGLSGRFATMLAMQAAIIAAALAGSVGGLRLREPHPTSLDPHRGYRPPVGDDPIFWREYVLPRRGSRVPAVITLAHRLLIVLRTLIVLALSAIFMAAAVIIPIGLVIAAGWFGYFAFRESWGIDVPPVGLPVAPLEFNFFIRAVTFFLGPPAMMGATTGVAGQIAIERDKKTWESLLTTPLTGPEILSSKLRGTGAFVWAITRWLIPLWLLGILCGALHPLGVVLAAVGLWTGTRLGLALGLWAAIRPGATSRSANSTSSLWSLALLLVGALTIVAPLCSAIELNELRRLDARLPWLAGVVLVAVAIAMASGAHSLIRRCFDRFDEWMGRPHRGGGAGREGGASAMNGPGPAAGASSPPRRPGDQAILARESRSGSTAR